MTEAQMESTILGWTFRQFMVAGCAADEGLIACEWAKPEAEDDPVRALVALQVEWMHVYKCPPLTGHMAMYNPEPNRHVIGIVGRLYYMCKCQWLPLSSSSPSYDPQEWSTGNATT